MKFKTVRGVEDVLPPESKKFSLIYGTFAKTAESYGFEEVILPLFEEASLFERSVGTETDIVQKEMYVFTDKGKRRLALRPEGTASAVRAYIQHAVYNLEPFTKWFYFGPMFRYERPQAGRNRQFYQAGCEIFGVSSPQADAELIKLGSDVLKSLSVEAELNINSIGCPTCRTEYKKKLINYLKDNEEGLCEDCRRRLKSNPLRVLDCKNETCRAVVKEAPKITDNLCQECKEHFQGVLETLKLLKVPFKVNPLIVRGLDYYTRTVFEFISPKLGAQSTVLAGGRYDGLVKELGGPDIPALGFALGVDRVKLLLPQREEKRSGVFVVLLEKSALAEALKILSEVRALGVRAELDLRFPSLKAQMKIANKRFYRFAVILGRDEIAEGFYTVKDLETGKQEKIESLGELLAIL